MLVKDLVARLQQMPQDAYVGVPDSKTPSCCCGSCRQMPKDVQYVYLADVNKDSDVSCFVDNKFKDLYETDFCAYDAKRKTTQVVLLWS
jgi:hypothetical protein